MGSRIVWSALAVKPRAALAQPRGLDAGLAATAVWAAADPPRPSTCVLAADEQAWTSDQKGDDAALNGHRTADRSFGIMTAPPLRRAEVQSHLRGIAPADFKALTTEPVFGLYGQ